jgi:hypothetical protein
MNWKGLPPRLPQKAKLLLHILYGNSCVNGMFFSKKEIFIRFRKNV